MAPGEACQFSYVNLARFAKDGEFNQKKFCKTVEVLTRLLDASVEYTIQNANDDLVLPLVRMKRRIGVGITGFADLLIQLGIPYDDERAVLLASKISELLDYHSKKMSVELALCRGAFPAYAKSRYKDQDWVRRKHHKMTGVIEEELWNELYKKILNKGVRHASTTSMPPTGTSSTIANSSKSLEPHFALKDHLGRVHNVVVALYMIRLNVLTKRK